MQEALFQYYGTDWIAPVLTFTALYLLGEKNRWGFVVGMVGCLCWIMMGVLVNSIPQIIANIIFFIINLRGWIKWSKD